MTTSFDDDEISAAGSRPIDLYTITTPTKTYHLTSHLVDVAFGGNTYTATTMSRGNLQVAQDLTGRELVVYLPISHELVQTFAATGIPEREVVVTLQRLQTASGQAQQQRTGFAQALTIDGHMAQVRVPSVTDDALKVRLPMIATQPSCVHVLYDGQCQVPRAGFQVATAFVSQAIGVGTVLVDISTMGGQPDAWAAPGGEIVHVATGERRSILSQVATTLSINVPFTSVGAGDAMLVFASCNHDIQTCKSKFNNVVNFVGTPYMNTVANPWVPSGLGIIQQT